MMRNSEDTGLPDPQEKQERGREGILEFARMAGFRPDAVQEKILLTASRRVILNCTRQWGKSSVTALKAGYEAWSVAGSVTLAASRSARQSGEFLVKVKQFLGRAGVKTRGDGHNAMSVVLENGSRIVAVPSREETIRCFSAVTLLVLDEAARVPDELFAAVSPMLAVSQGSLWVLSTPWGKQGFFYEIWMRGGPEWEKVAVPAAECPRIPASFLEEEKRLKGEREFRREYCCEFAATEDMLFDRDLIEEAVVEGEEVQW